jgi:hypothetical protein
MTHAMRAGWTGKITLSSESSSISSNDYFTQPLPLCQFESKEPSAVVLSLSIMSDNNTQLQPTDRTYFCGQPVLTSIPATVETGTPLAMLILEYGIGSVWRRVIADARPGNYQLPPVQSARAAINCYPGTVIGGPGSSFAGSFIPGRHERPTRLTNTFGSEVPDNDEVTPIYVPSSARWFDAWAEESLDIGNPDNPIVEVKSVDRSCGVPLITRDYTTGLWTPSFQPVELDACANGTGSTTETAVLTMRNRGATQSVFWIRFFLEL